MKIYFKSVTGTYNIEVEDNLGEVSLALDRAIAANDKKETRRHCSLDAYNLDGNLFPDGTDIEGDYIRNEENEKLHLAVSKLKPKQAALINEVYFGGVDPAEIAKFEGNTSVYNRLKRAYANLKKILEQENRE